MNSNLQCCTSRLISSGGIESPAYWRLKTTVIVTPENVPAPSIVLPSTVHARSRTNVSASCEKLRESFTSENVPAISALKSIPSLRDAGTNMLPDVAPFAFSVMARRNLSHRDRTCALASSSTRTSSRYNGLFLRSLGLAVRLPSPSTH